MSLQVNFKRWIFLCIIIPISLLLLMVNVAVWRNLKNKYDGHLSGTSESVRSEINGILSVERVRLESLAGLPMIYEQLDRRAESHADKSDTAWLQEISIIEEGWFVADATDERVRAVIDTEVSAMFRKVTETDKNILSIWLTDEVGALVSASDKPAHFAHGSTDWFDYAQQRPKGQVVSEGISSDDRVSLALALWDPSNPDLLRGALHLELNLENLLSGIRSPEQTGTQAVLLIGDKGWLISGEEPFFKAVSEPIAKLFQSEKPQPQGWKDGIRRYGRPLHGGIDWFRRAWVVTVRREFMLAPSIYAPLLMLIIASIATLYLLVRLSRRAGKRIFIDPMKDLIQAGNWAMRKAYHADSKFHKLSSDVSIAMDETSGPPSHLEQDLDEWLATYKQDLMDEMKAQTHEVHHDLDLARDFQMAYLNRPYPKIPEVHVEGRLRLDFYHQYKPALALGGDFFDILHLASDCAGIFVADVMGHGTRSALITAILRTLMGDLAPSGRNARHFVMELNKQFEAMLRSVPNPLFASAFYFVADTTARVATYSSAGHPAPFQVRRSVGRVQRVQVPRPRGAALGIIPDESYTGGHCRLIPGDVFIFFTDGVYEVHNSEGVEYGVNRMESVLRKTMYKTVRQMVDGIMESVMEFAGNQPLADDICIVAVEVTTELAEPTEPEA